MRGFDDTHTPQEGEKQERVEFWRRMGKSLEVVPGSLGFKAMIPLTHLLCLFAPFCFSWDAVGIAFGLYIITGLGVTLSYHRNLSHRSYKLPKWLEYLFAYCGVHAFQSNTQAGDDGQPKCKGNSIPTETKWGKQTQQMRQRNHRLEHGGTRHHFQRFPHSCPKLNPLLLCSFLWRVIKSPHFTRQPYNAAG
nr:palmitoyl-monogalactosyldiacylglycerol delta-7 desaturase, chloroplastic-like [Ipomoea batatas]